MTSVAYGIAMPASRGLLTPPSWCSQAQAFFARLATQPSAARKVQYNTLIASLANAGLWSKLDALYVFAAADQATALTNLISSSYGASAVGAPAFTTDQGFTGGTSKYLDSNFKPSTAGGNFQQNSACGFAWSLTAGAIGAATVGSKANASPLTIYPYQTGSLLLQGVINGVSFSPASVSVSSGAGLSAVDRGAPNAQSIYRNGTALASNSTASAALANQDIVFLTTNLVEWYNGTVAVGGFGGHLSATDHANLYSALHAYLQAVAGVP